MLGMIEKKLAEIMYLGMMINTRTEYCIFINIAGHVDQVEVNIRESKEEYDVEIARCQQYYDATDTEARLDGIIKVLADVLETKVVDYEAFSSYYVEIKKYTF